MFIKKKYKKLAVVSIAISLMASMLLFTSCTDEEIAYYQEMIGKSSEMQTPSDEDVTSEIVEEEEQNKDEEISSQNECDIPQSSNTQEKPSTNNQTSTNTQTSSKAPVSSKETTSSKAPVVVEKPAPSQPTPKPNVSSQPTSSYVPQVNQNSMQAIEDRIIDMVNELRVSVGVAPVTKNNKLTQAAYIRSEEMLRTGQFSHTRPDGSSCFTAIKATGYNYMTVGENIGYAKGHAINTIAKVMFDGWKNSPGHYKNMVKADFKEIGVSVCTDGTTTYATQHFGTQR